MSRLELLSFARPREIKKKVDVFVRANRGCLMITTELTSAGLCLLNLIQAETYQGQQEPKESEETG